MNLPNVDAALQDVLPKFGYTLNGWSNWAKQAQELYHAEVISWEELVARIERKETTPPEEQNYYNKWLLDNKDRITALCKIRF